MSMAGVVAVGSYWQRRAVGWRTSDWTIVKGFNFIPSAYLSRFTHSARLPVMSVF